MTSNDYLNSNRQAWIRLRKEGSRMGGRGT
jgi:hypothetical protein